MDKGSKPAPMEHKFWFGFGIAREPSIAGLFPKNLRQHFNCVTFQRCTMGDKNMILEVGRNKLLNDVFENVSF